MRFNFVLGTVALVGVMNACGTDSPDVPDAGHEHGGGGDAVSDAGSLGDGHGDAGDTTSEGGGDTGGTKSGGRGGAGGSKSDGKGGAGGSMSTGHGGSGGAKSDGKGGSSGTAGSTSAGHGGSGGSDGGVGGTSVPIVGGAGGESGADEGGGAGDSGGAGEHNGGASNEGGTGGDVSSAGGTGGASANGGTSGSSANAGSGGSAGSSGSGGISGNAGGGGAGGEETETPEYLFTEEQFGGNGRTCVTCHTAATGTISPAQIQALHDADPNGPLFRPIDSEDGAGNDYTELLARATFRVSINLPAGVTLTSNPSATSIVFRRSVPSTINTPALDPTLMWDGRAPNLMEQALGAILGHAQATTVPSESQLELIAAFEQGPAFFSSDILRAYAQGGTAPTWPPGVTDAEKRGRRWFAQEAAAPRFNICGQCHGGPMTNETQSNSGLPVGKHFQTVNVSEFNTLGNPQYEFAFPDPKNPGSTVTVVTPDPGRALTTGDVRDLNFFKIPTLWGVKNTAPYFHDNSANTLEELMDHYEKHLATFLRSNVSYPTPHVPTAQDKADIVAYLKLL
ncbi:MAG TPA: cytochrome c peroxidase [Polyangiaceae bacterium]|nr:cytochrome c peroxidase [Polyangiaceae bacterium]